MQNRKDSTGYDWKLTLINKGIYTNGTLLEIPENEATVFNDENEINFKHKHFTEQYINSEQGVRQNFIVDNVPENTNEIFFLNSGFTIRITSPISVFSYSTLRATKTPAGCAGNTSGQAAPIFITAGSQAWQTGSTDVPS